MSVQYSFELYFPAEKALDVIQHGIHSVPTWSDRQCEIITPTHESITVPYFGQCEKVYIEPWKVYTIYDIVLLLPWDEVLDGYYREHSNTFPVNVGFVLGERYSMFGIAAQWRWMNEVFLKSISLRNLMNNLLRDNDGILGILDPEDDYLLVLPDLEYCIELSIHEWADYYFDWEQSEFAVDEWVDKLLGLELRPTPSGYP